MGGERESQGMHGRRELERKKIHGGRDEMINGIIIIIL